MVASLEAQQGAAWLGGPRRRTLARVLTLLLRPATASWGALLESLGGAAAGLTVVGVEGDSFCLVVLVGTRVGFFTGLKTLTWVCDAPACCSISLRFLTLDDGRSRTLAAVRLGMEDPLLSLSVVG